VAEVEADYPALRSLEERARHARAAERTVRGLVPVLGAGLVGVLLLLGGLAWDALIHARDPDAAHVETSLFSLANPSHGLLLAGGALVVASLTTAAVRALALARTPWLASRGMRIAVVVVVLAAALVTGRARSRGVSDVRVEVRPRHLGARVDLEGVRGERDVLHVDRGAFG
jgi:hypothetical protein